MLDELIAGGKRAVADALARLEASPMPENTAALLDEAFRHPKGAAIGLTGPPGVGKSTLTDALVRGWRARGRTVAVLAVDPSSARTGGALLGDRTRITTDPADSGTFVRSMAARDRLGGVAEITLPATVLMRALYDLVLIETVGIGQSETEIAGIADMTVFLAQPGSGDALQYMKAGIMEVPDLVAVTKADTGIAARRTASDLAGALSLASEQEVPVMLCSAVDGTGIDVLLHGICKKLDTLSPRFVQARLKQVESWTEDCFRRRFGTFGTDFGYHKCENFTYEAPFLAHLRRFSQFETSLRAVLG